MTDTYYAVQADELNRLIDSKNGTIETLKQENKRLLEARNHFMADNLKYYNALEEIKSIANKFDYWSNNLTDASNVINEIKDKVEEVLGC